MLVEELNTEDFQNADTDVFLVKLTDSCMKCLEKVAAEDPDSCKLSLDSRDGNFGSLTIAYGDEKRTFDFAAADMAMDPKGSYECVRRLSHAGYSQALASMRTKLTIQATDDVYSATREKIAMAEENAKKNHAKEIKTSSRSKVVKRVIRKTPSISSPATAGRSGGGSGGGGKVVPPIMRQSAALDKAEAAKKAANAAAFAAKAKTDDGGGIFSDKGLRDRVVHLLALKAYTEPEILLRLKRDGLSEADKAKLHDVLCQVGQPNRQNKYLLLPKLFGDVRLDWPAYNNEDRVIIGRRRAAAQRVTDNLNSKQADKERAFQQSSARRHTRPAPLAGAGSAVPTEKKLQAIAEVGARKDDEDLLRQVALKYCVSRDTLSRWIINEELLRNRRAKELGVRPETLAAATTTVVVEPPPPPRVSPKRPATLTEDAESTLSSVSAKRNCQRLPSPISDVSPTSSGCRASPNSPPLRRPLPPSSSSSVTVTTASTTTTTTIVSSTTIAASADSAAHWPPAERPPSIESGPGPSWQREAGSGLGRKGSPEGRLGLRASPKDDFDDLANAKATADLLREYPPIKSDSQKTKYKQEFHHDYKEYTDLYRFVNEWIEKLKQLDTELNSYPVDSADYEKVGQKVLHAMKTLHSKGDPVRMRQRLEHLDAKLSHIKKQVSDYNRHRVPMQV